MAIIKYRVEAAVTHTDGNYDTNVIESAWHTRRLRLLRKWVSC